MNNRLIGAKIHYKMESKYECEIFGTMVVRPTEDNTPNAFYRLMHTVLLGFKWRISKNPPREVAISSFN